MTSSSPDSHYELAALQDVIAERRRQDALHGTVIHHVTQNRPVSEWFIIGAEEDGEVAKEVVEITFGKDRRKELRKELVEAAACHIAAIYALDLEDDLRGRDGLIRQCSWCLAIEGADGTWTFGVDFKVSGTHGICPSCLEEQLKLLPPVDMQNPHTVDGEEA